MGLLLVAPRGAVAAERPRERDALPPGLELAIDRGLWFLQKQQKPNGSFDATGPTTAMTGLGLLAYLSAGHVADAGKYGSTVRHAVDYLVEVNPEGGYYGRDGGRLYGHCIVTIALAEACGMETDDAQYRKIRAVLEKALRVIEAAQDVPKDAVAAGGWRQEPNSKDSDLLMTGWCMAALRACRGAGLAVPKERIDRAVAYARRCYRRDQQGFAYMPRDVASASMTGMAMLNLYLLGAASRAEMAAAGKHLIDKPVREGSRQYYYSLFHATQAALQVGESVWPVVWRNTYEQLLASQRREDGSWSRRSGDEPGGENSPGRFYSTAMAVLTLSTPLRLLPSYQR